MKHHFGDLLDREGDYWTIIPNRERFVDLIERLQPGDEQVKVVTVEGNSPAWHHIKSFANLEELTLHSPTEVQLTGLAELTHIKRLRITHARPKEISVLGELCWLEELVLEYVSGFSDLSPLQKLSRLKSVHFENLRRVSDFGGLAGIHSLRYLSIDGTLDWKQPILDFEFLRTLPNLEVLSLGGVALKAPFPATLPLMTLKKLKRIRIPRNMLVAEEYALMEVGLKGLNGSTWGPQHQLRYSAQEEWFEFTGKGAGRAKCGHPDSARKCAEYAAKYEAMKNAAASLLEAEGIV